MPSELRYSTQQIGIGDVEAVIDALWSPWLTQGPTVERFEEALAEYVGAKYAVAVNSGTAALHVAMAAAGMQDGNTAITSPLSFVATANAALMCGIGDGLHFMDVDAATGNIGPPLGVGRSCDFVVPVHFAGRAAQIQTDRHQIAIIEDACHALGAVDFDGCSRVGSCAHSMATCFSFHPVKPITTGEGGAVTTNDEGLRDEMRLLRSHGRDASGLMVKMGYNYRMTEMAAALGLSQLKRCSDMRKIRRDFACEYGVRLAGVRGVETFDPRPYATLDHHSWHLFPVRIKNGRRDEVKAKLNEQGIGAQVHYSPIIPLQPYYRDRFWYEPGTWPNAEAWAAEELSLPLHAGMTEADVERVVVALKEAL